MINNEYLYHFTSSENLIRILETMSLKLSDFKKLNDLNENNIPHYYFINRLSHLSLSAYGGNLKLG